MKSINDGVTTHHHVKVYGVKGRRMRSLERLETNRTIKSQKLEDLRKELSKLEAKKGTLTDGERNIYLEGLSTGTHLHNQLLKMEQEALTLKSRI